MNHLIRFVAGAGLAVALAGLWGCKHSSEADAPSVAPAAPVQEQSVAPSTAAPAAAPEAVPAPTPAPQQ